MVISLARPLSMECGCYRVIKSGGFLLKIFDMGMKFLCRVSKFNFELFSVAVGMPVASLQNT